MVNFAPGQEPDKRLEEKQQEKSGPDVEENPPRLVNRPHSLVLCMCVVAVVPSKSMEAIAIRLEAIATRLEAIAIRLFCTVPSKNMFRTKVLRFILPDGTSKDCTFTERPVD